MIFTATSSNSNCYIPTNITINLSNGFSITGWFYFVETYNTHLIIVDNMYGYQDGNPSNFIALRKFNYDYNIERVTNNGNIDNQVSLESILPTTNGNGWFHIGLVFTGTNVKFYINNSQNNFADNTIYTNFVPKYVFIGNNGSFKSSDTIQPTPKMYCHDFRIYNAALTATDISGVYNYNVR